ncbi:ATP-dependent RNA helicase DHX8-like [Microplitis mediator]|uniref:ATP-dependent RNA helicase DHX8-like n=1 Tax=Microplitis mediator TaxID=375433 RepID=UPI0025534ACA|nr:ATP-dependent RNA helicase DHX8-like [Microplitis mediator]
MELNKHLGLDDEVLADVIINVGTEKQTIEGFKQALQENGENFSDSLMDNSFKIIAERKPAKDMATLEACASSSSQISFDESSRNKKKSKKYKRRRRSRSRDQSKSRHHDRSRSRNRNSKRRRSRSHKRSSRDRKKNKMSDSRSQSKVVSLTPQTEEMHTGKVTKMIEYGCILPGPWETKQMSAADCYSEKEIVKLHERNLEEDHEIELVKKDPPFVPSNGRALWDLSPIRLVKNPNGSLAQAARMQSGFAKNRKEQKMLQKTNLNILEDHRNLPIFELKDELVKAVTDKQILIINNETGSNHTILILRYLEEAGFTTRGKIGCSQPRGFAAMSVAKRVAEEFACQLGQKVGYTIRFEDCTSAETNIHCMTDGMLLRECLIDLHLTKYSVIMLDAAHERTASTDVLFGLLKQAVERRPDLKLIVTISTINAEKFSQYFKEDLIFTIPRRTFGVEIMYTEEPELDYFETALITVMQIHIQEPPGDVLLFLTGQEEIDMACEILYKRMKSLGPDVSELLILPVYSADMQIRIYKSAPPGSRKVVIATDIAKTSLTIDGIRYVVDPGFVKQKVYNPKSGVDSMIVTPISQAAAKQRASRAGRTAPGKCYRLYTESAYRDEMLPTPVPEIQRTNLATIVLQLKSMGFNNFINFGFIDPPPPELLLMAFELLYSLGALDNESRLTQLGRRMAEFPLEPNLSKMLIMSVQLQCSDEILTIVSMLSVKNIFHWPKYIMSLADQTKAKFNQPEGDHVTLLAVYNSWKNNNYSEVWCYENFVNVRTLHQARHVRQKLLRTMDRLKLDIVSAGNDTVRVQKAVCSGYFRNAARKNPQGGYRTLVDSQVMYIHPSSALFNRQPEWVIYHELVQTTRKYMREVTTIFPKWLVEFAPSVYENSKPY